MNWIEIDKILYNIIERHNNTADIYTEAEKHFNWSRSQSKAAIDPILNRMEWKPHDQPSATQDTVPKGKKKSP